MNTLLYALGGLVCGLAIAGLAGVYFYRRLDSASALFDICIASITLERLRSQNVAGAIECNEKILDSMVMRLGQQLRSLPRYPGSRDGLYWLHRASKYRRNFPRTSGIPEVDSEVTRALALAGPDEPVA